MKYDNTHDHEQSAYLVPYRDSPLDMSGMDRVSELQQKQCVVERRS
jgi:hypothetical protein